MSTIENLRKSARRWLKALRADDADAHARLKRANPNAPSNPALRDVQHALAREHGHKSWIDLRRALNDGKRRGAAIFESWALFLDALRLDGEHSDVDARVAVVPPQSDPGPSGMLQPLLLDHGADNGTFGGSSKQSCKPRTYRR